MDLFEYVSADEERKVGAYLWEPEGEVRAVIQLVHGMQEHIGRYEEVAEYFMKQGFAVVGNDHLGHGRSVAVAEDYSYITKKEPSSVLAEDVYKLNKFLKERYKGKPLIIISHSMGTFVTQRALEEFKAEAQGVIFIGTGCYPYPVLLFAKLVVNITQFLKGERHKSRFIDFVVKGSYNKRIENRASDNAWLTRDLDIVKRYDESEQCGVPFTVNAYRGLFDTLIYIQKGKNRRLLPGDIPFLFVYGKEDSVGNYGKAPEAVAHKFRSIGKKAMTKAYADCRHELLNELNKMQVMKDLEEWINKEVLDGQK